MGALDAELGKAFADCCQQLLINAYLTPQDIIAIGSHGQTIRHRPPGSPQGNFTLQIGDPNLIAELTGITTVADFRRRDMAAGGQGAPLVPAFHHAMFQSADKDRAIVNIGGMANITWLPQTRLTCGFDTGPGNVLMDHWIQQHLGKPYDKDGSWAATGRVLPDLLGHLLAETFFKLPPPKSTGRELFNYHWLDEKLAAISNIFRPEDVQASLLELTAVSISQSIAQLSDRPKEIIICGGGAYNTGLMKRLEILSGNPVFNSAQLGVDPQWVEAMAFAWLAYQTINHRTGNLCAVTGAKRDVILGGIYSA
jgi:anhydro-N-acetylmuramic acid kinase